MDYLVSCGNRNSVSTDFPRKVQAARDPDLRHHWPCAIGTLSPPREFAKCMPNNAQQQFSQQSACHLLNWNHIFFYRMNLLACGN